MNVWPSFLLFAGAGPQHGIVLPSLQTESSLKQKVTLIKAHIGQEAS
jgi:hypothetical protein